MINIYLVLIYIYIYKKDTVLIYLLSLCLASIFVSSFERGLNAFSMVIRLAISRFLFSPNSHENAKSERFQMLHFPNYSDNNKRERERESD